MIKRKHLFVLGASIVAVTVTYMIFVHYSTGLTSINKLYRVSGSRNLSDKQHNITLAISTHIRASTNLSTINNTNGCKVNGTPNGMVLDKRRHIIIIGAMSFLGARLAMHFHEQGYHVLAVEDLLSVDNDDMKWYRWTELMRNRIPVQVIMLSRNDKLQSLLHHSPQAIIYVPTRADGIDRNDQLVTSTLRNFLLLISVLKSSRNTPQIVLISHSKSAIGRGWLIPYEAILSMTLSRSAVVRVSNVHGPWQDSNTAISSPLWYVNDVSAVVEKALATGQFLWDMDQCTHFFDDANSVSLAKSEEYSTMIWTQKWLKKFESFLSKRVRNVTLGAYLVGVSYVSQYGKFPVSNQLRYFYNWFTTSIRHGMDVVLFHDTMSDGFQTRLKRHYPKTETIRVKPISSMIANDQRFYFIYNYLLVHDEINRAITTDIRDVEFLQNPAELMTLIGDYIYTGLDIPFDTEVGHHGQANAYKRCYPELPRAEVFRTYGVFNIGVVGGTRAALLSLLTHLLLNMDLAVHVGNSCCDMPTVELLMHTRFFDSAFVGYPFNSAFFTQTPGPVGLAVRHKPEW